MEGVSYKGRSGRVLRPLCPIFSDWIAFSKRWTKIFDYDAVWWYNERASVSVLAAAITWNGGVVLEELTNHKKVELRGGSNALAIGRADMVFRFKKWDFVLEAKQLWLSAQSENASDKIQEALREAKKNVVATVSYGSQRLGAVFVTPWVAKSVREKTRLLIQSLIDQIKRDVDYGAFAYVFPRAARALKWEGETVFYPGSMLLLRVPRSG